MRSRSYLWLSLPIVALSGCSPSEVDVLKTLPMPMTGQQMTVQAAFADHANCKNVEWKAFDERTVTKVKVTCEVKDLEGLRNHLVNLERTADEQALARFKSRQEQSVNQIQRSIEALKERIELGKQKTFTFAPLESLPKRDRYRLNCDEYAEKVQHPMKRIERHKTYIGKFCTEGSSTYSAQFCAQARERYNVELPQLQARIDGYMSEMKACQLARASDQEQLQAINEERARQVREAEARHAQLLKDYEVEVARKEAELVQVQNMKSDNQYDLDRAANQKLADVNKIKSLQVQFVFRMTVDKKEAIIESVSTDLKWSNYDAPAFNHAPKLPMGYDAEDIVRSMITNRKLWDCANDALMCRKIDNTLIPIYIVR